MNAWLISVVKSLTKLRELREKDLVDSHLPLITANLGPLKIHSLLSRTDLRSLHLHGIARIPVCLKPNSCSA